MDRLPSNILTPAANREIRILICDDDRTLLFSLSKVLGDQGYEVLSTTDPKDAVGILKETPCTVIVSGMFMQTMDGENFRGLVRVVAPSTPMLFLVGNVNERSCSFMESVGKEANSFFVSRGATPEQFLFKLDKVLAEYRFRTYRRKLDKSMETELSLAVNLQRSMLPPFAGLEKDFIWCFLYSPYKRISGDVFEMLRLSENERVLVFGDITGHGIHSAMAMMAIQSYLKNYCFGADREALPRMLATDMNRYLWQNLRGRIYMCGVIVYLNLQNNLMRLFNAGHHDLVCIDKDNKTVPVNPRKLGSMPLGLIPDQKFPAEEQAEFKFSDDDVFVICSDGILELTKDEKGIDCIPPGFFESAAETAVEQARETGQWIVFPFLLHDTLSRSGFKHAHDDLMLAVFAKRNAIAADVRYNAYCHCTRLDLRKCAARLEEWANVKYGADIARRMGMVAQARIETILGNGFGSDILDEESVSINVIDSGKKLTVTIWDYGEEYRTDREDAVALAEGALAVDGRRLADRLNEFRFTISKSAEGDGD